MSTETGVALFNGCENGVSSGTPDPNYASAVSFQELNVWIVDVLYV